jgi:hypothetical protein
MEKEIEKERKETRRAEVSPSCYPLPPTLLPMFPLASFSFVSTLSTGDLGRLLLE